MTNPASKTTVLAMDDAPSSTSTVRYEGLDDTIIERSDSTFPPPAATDPEPDAWLEPPPMVSMKRWFELLRVS